MNEIEKKEGYQKENSTISMGKENSKYFIRIKFILGPQP